MDYSNLNAETVKPGWERLVYGNFLGRRPTGVPNLEKSSYCLRLQAWWKCPCGAGEPCLTSFEGLVVNVQISVILGVVGVNAR